MSLLIQRGETAEICGGETFRAKRVEENLIRLRWVAAIYVGLVTWFITLNMIAYGTGTRDFPPKLWQGILYLTLLIVNVGILVLVKARPVKKSETVRRYQWFICGYMVLIMSIGALISIVDQPDYGHLTVFIMNVLICSSFFLTERRQILCSIGFSTAIISFGLPLVVSSSGQLIGFYQELISYIPVSYFVSRVVYKAFCDHYVSQVHLSSEIEKNEDLNKRLQKTNFSLQKANTDLKELALVDELTGIPNRRGFYNYLDSEIDVNNASEGRHFVVVMIDIDYFKEYNDYYGHVAGDESLNRIAHALSGIAEIISGFVCRWGGEEFLCVVPDYTKDDAVLVCRKIFNTMAALKILHEDSAAGPYVSLSIGAFSSVAHGTEDIIGGIQQADRALYEVKAAGRNGYRVEAAESCIDKSQPTLVVAEMRANQTA